MAQESTALFVVTGTVYAEGSPVVSELDVDVTNLTTGVQKLVRTGEAGEGQYVATYIDMEGSRAAAVGDAVVREPVRDVRLPVAGAHARGHVDEPSLRVVRRRRGL